MRGPYIWGLATLKFCIYFGHRLCKYVQNVLRIHRGRLISRISPPNAEKLLFPARALRSMISQLQITNWVKLPLNQNKHLDKLLTHLVLANPFIIASLWALSQSCETFLSACFRPSKFCFSFFTRKKIFNLSATRTISCAFVFRF